ncbi:MAG: glycosyltransferase family 2 protein [Gaiellaceae bacterium]
MSSADVLPVTAIVASRNEAHLLRRCLDALTFCDEIVVVDIESTDETPAIAREFGARILPHPYVAIADEARPEAIASARHDWVLLRDPDEVMPPSLRAQIVELFRELDPAVGLITGPIRYYFAGRLLRGTAWGGVRTARMLARRDLIDFPTTVHGKLTRKPGSRDVDIPFTGDNAIEHYWSAGYRDVVEKHRRYLRLEGAARADAGETTSMRRILAAPLPAFYDSFVRKRGYRDGVHGLLLSVMWSVYRAGTQVALLRELRRRREDSTSGPYHRDG